MHTILLEPKDGLPTLLKKIADSISEEVGVPVSMKNPVTTNLLNLKLIEQLAKKINKKVNFIPTDEISKEISENLQKNESSSPRETTFGFVVGKDIQSEVSKNELPREKKLSFPRLRLSFPKVNKLRLIIPILILLFCAAGFSAYALVSFLPSATISIDLENESLTRVVDLTASTSADALDVGKRVLPAVKISSETSGSGVGEGTGRKEIGEVASGTMKIYNKTGSPVSLKKGARFRKITVEPGKDLQFVLSADTLISQREATSSPQPGYVFGQAEGAVTAEKFGPEYNLASGTTFEVAGFPTTDMTAQNNSDFSGGSRQLVRVVTAEDQKKVYELLLADLTERVRSDVRSRLQPEQKLDDSAVEIVVTKKTYDKKVNEEAERFNLELSVTGFGYAYSQKDVEDLLSKIIDELLPAGFEYSSSEKSTSISGVKVTGQSANGAVASIKITAKVKGFIVKKLDKEKLKEAIAGKSLAEAQRFVESLPGVTGVKIELLPNLPFLRNLPRSASRIKVETVVK